MGRQTILGLWLFGLVSTGGLGYLIELAIHYTYLAAFLTYVSYMSISVMAFMGSKVIEGVLAWWRLKAVCRRDYMAELKEMYAELKQAESVSSESAKLIAASA